MSGSTETCLCCDAVVYAGTLSLRGWCTKCEAEFRRMLVQREARRVLQLELHWQDEVDSSK